MKTLRMLLLITVLLTSSIFPTYASVDTKVIGSGRLTTDSTTTITVDADTVKEFDKIENISLVNMATKNIVGSKFEVELIGNQYIISISPMRNLAQNSKYTLKIYTPNYDYAYGLNLPKYLNFEDYKIILEEVGGGRSESGTPIYKDAYYRRIEVPENPAKGFYYPYFLTVPLGTEGKFGIVDCTYEYPTTSISKYLLVSPNNTGAVSSQFFAEEVLETDSRTGDSATVVAKSMEMPLLVPAFPRPNFTDTYTHMLDEETLFMTKAQSDKFGLGNLVGIDKQLRAMIADAKEQFKANGITLESKVALDGFSASADFVHRFSMLYPEDVELVIHQTTVPVYPLNSYKSTTLNFPLGTNDYNAKFGKAFNMTAYKAIKQFWFLGSEDSGNILNFSDGFNEKDRNTIAKLWGVDGIQRFNTIKTIYKDYTNIQFHMYQGIGHQVSDILYSDMGEFLRLNLGETKLVTVNASDSGK